MQILSSMLMPFGIKRLLQILLPALVSIPGRFGPIEPEISPTVYSKFQTFLHFLQFISIAGIYWMYHAMHWLIKQMKMKNETQFELEIGLDGGSDGQSVDLEMVDVDDDGE